MNTILQFGFECGFHNKVVYMAWQLKIKENEPHRGITKANAQSAVSKFAKLPLATGASFRLLRHFLQIGKKLIRALSDVFF